MVAFGCGTPIIATATSTCIDGAPTSYVAPTTIGTTSAVGSLVRPIIGSGIATIAGCSVTSEGAPSAPVFAHPTEGTGATMGSSCPADDAVTLAPLQPKMGVMPADHCRLT